MPPGRHERDNAQSSRPHQHSSKNEHVGCRVDIQSFTHEGAGLPARQCPVEGQFDGALDVSSQDQLKVLVNVVVDTSGLISCMGPWR
ncbi:hypothetical protein, partial [Candidatus Frankia alpina]|uniref:hypothetical protein n=1 Tax=Candidatus Frankia alpina TaxID=2699483 RepID=UPI001A997D3E